MKVLVLGARGMLGQSLTFLLSKSYEVIGWDLAEIDITQHAALERKILEVRPDLVINCTGYTDVDGCEAKADQAFAVNAEGVKNIALACARIPSKVIHLSTDYVFDGSKRIPYREEDSPNPMSIYGKSKLKGERYLQELSKNYLIIRTQWLYGPKGKNFVDAILRQTQTKKELQVVNDQYGAPTYTKDLSWTIEKLISTDGSGIVHVANTGICSWFEFAQKILEEKGIQGVSVKPISSMKLARPAVRPSYSALDCSRLENITGKKMRSWAEALKEYLSSA